MLDQEPLEIIDKPKDKRESLVSGDVMEPRHLKINADCHDLIGFDSLPYQQVNKSDRKGYEFNILCVGESGIGKTTLIESLFNLPTPSNSSKSESRPPLSCVGVKEVSVASRTHDLHEKNIQLKLTVVETVGYGDQLNKENSFKPIVEYVDQQLEAYFQEELKIRRCLSLYSDTRIHACLYFICPTGRGLKAIDVLCMKSLVDKVNIIPVIGKADAISKSELKTFKEQIVKDLEGCGIKIYQFPQDEVSEDAEVTDSVNEDIPFAVVGSRDFVEIGDKVMRARIYPWGIVKVENEKHCDFVKLREMLIRTHMVDLIEETHNLHYELYRKSRLEQIGFSDVDELDDRSLRDRYRQKVHQQMEELMQREEDLKQKFVRKIRDKEAEFKEAEMKIKKKLDTLTEKNAQDILEIEDWHGQLSIDKMMFERFTKEYTEKSRKASDSFLPQSFSLSSLGKKQKSTEENSAGS